MWELRGAAVIYKIRPPTCFRDWIARAGQGRAGQDGNVFPKGAARRGAARRGAARRWLLDPGSRIQTQNTYDEV